MHAIVLASNIMNCSKSITLMMRVGSQRYNCIYVYTVLAGIVWEETMYSLHTLSHCKYSNLNSHSRTSRCELGPRDPTKKLTTMAPKDQMSVFREIHSGRTSLQDMGKDVWSME